MRTLPVLALIGLLLPVAPFSCSSGDSNGSDSSGGAGMDAGTTGGNAGEGGDADGSTGGTNSRGGSGDGGAGGRGGSDGAAGEGGSPSEEPCTPTGPEECDEIDNDCNGLIDDGLGVEVRRSSDGTVVEDAEACDRPDDADNCALGSQVCQAGVVVCDEQDGRDPETGEGGEEICDDEDNNCDGQIDEGFGVKVLDAINGTVLAPAQPCDGDDDDLCTEGFWQCNSLGVAVCSDTTLSNFDDCDGVDNDCNPETLEDDLPTQGSCSTSCGSGALKCTNGQWLCNVPGPTEPNCSDPTADRDCNGVTDGDQQNIAGSVRHYLDDDNDGYPRQNAWVMYCNNGSPRGKYKFVPQGYTDWDCCDSDADAHPGQTNFFGEANECGSFDYNCKDGAKPKPTVESTGVPHNQCFQSCVDTPNGRSGWDFVFCGTCNPACGKVCPHVIMSQCVFPPTSDKRQLCN